MKQARLERNWDKIQDNRQIKEVGKVLDVNFKLEGNWIVLNVLYFENFHNSLTYFLNEGQLLSHV